MGEGKARRSREGRGGTTSRKAVEGGKAASLALPLLGSIGMVVSVATASIMSLAVPTCPFTENGWEGLANMVAMTAALTMCGQSLAGVPRWQGAGRVGAELSAPARPTHAAGHGRKPVSSDEELASLAVQLAAGCCVRFRVVLP